MVDDLLFCDEQQTESNFLIREDNIFVNNREFTEMGVLENIAQTCAARLGYLSNEQPVKIGMIGSVDNFEIKQLAFVGEKLKTNLVVSAEILNVVLVKATVYCNDKLIASCSMKVVLTETPGESQNPT